MTDIQLPNPAAAIISERNGVMLITVPGWETLYRIVLYLYDGPRRFFYRGSVRELFSWKKQVEMKFGRYIRIEINKIEERPQLESWLDGCIRNCGG